MTALDLCSDWPVSNVAAAVIRHDVGADPDLGSRVSTVVSVRGDTGRHFRLASLSKPITAWAILVAVEEGIVDLDAEIDIELAGQVGCTLRHLLAHAGGYPFDGTRPISVPERTRIYSNGGIELAARLVCEASEMPFAEYLELAVLEPLGMTSSSLRGSPAHAMTSTVDDVVRFLTEVSGPRLVSSATARDAISVQYPSLGGIVPGVGRYGTCPWGLGFERRGAKSPHWTGARNSGGTYGHFGGAGTMMWTDPDAGVSLVALTDRPFDEWSQIALRKWPEQSDAVLREFGAARGTKSA